MVWLREKDPYSVSYRHKKKNASNSYDPRVGDSAEENLLRRHQAIHRGVCKVDAKSALQDLWVACRADCMCLGTPAGVDASSSSQASQDVNCPYVLCDLGNAISFGVNKNNRLTAMPELSQYIAAVLHSTEITEERRSAMSGALSCLLGCQATKLRNVANVGFLTELCPRLLSLQLQKGWGNLWGQLSKLSTALGYHQDHESHVAVLIFLRRQCVPDDNWHWFLQSDDRAMEQRLHQTTFTGCFVEAMKERAGEATPVTQEYG
ncbi:hypothetical protein OS493_029043 [Desmophyllum pertusum]|uniref:Uncharacterized protein n=1 Tax=Desmophyllum pertusum TaxID=174260 RepID=A0A9W9YK43_9CNID|nr:hypothetical protein OS493_029043 [Desmophyllum pertusum]